MNGALLSLLSAVLAASPAAALPPVPPVVRQILPNGVHVVVLRDRSAPLVAASAVFSGGLRVESAEEAGVTLVLAGSWTGGCGRFEMDAVHRALEADGSSMAGFAGRDVIGLRAEWSRDGWERGLDLLADCVIEPRFAPRAMAAAREDVRVAAAERSGDPAWIAHELLARELAVPGRPDGALPDEAALDRIDRHELYAHYRAHYPVAAMTLAVVGDVDPGSVVARARARFGSSPRVRRPQPATAGPLPGAPARDREVYREVTGDRGVATVALGFPAVARGHRDRAALEVAVELLAGPGRAVLVADQAAGHVALHRDCRPEDLPAALTGLRGAIDRLRAGVSEAEVRAAASRLARARRDALGRPAHAAALLALYEVLGPGAEGAAGHVASLAAVRAVDVRNAAQRYLRPELAVVATALPRLASPEAARRLRGVVRPPPGARAARSERGRSEHRKRRRRR